MDEHPRHTERVPGGGFRCRIRQRGGLLQPAVRLSAVPDERGEAKGRTGPGVLAERPGRPPRPTAAGSTSASRTGLARYGLIRTHWESDTNGFGADLDPVVFGRRPVDTLRVVCMRMPPFIPCPRDSCAINTRQTGFETSSSYYFTTLHGD